GGCHGRDYRRTNVLPGQDSQGHGTFSESTRYTSSVCRLECCQTGKGTRDDDAGRILQGGTGAIEFSHNRSNANYVRFLPALPQIAAGPTRQSNGAQGLFVWQPQRHGQGTWDGASFPRGF